MVIERSIVDKYSGCATRNTLLEQYQNVNSHKKKINVKILIAERISLTDNFNYRLHELPK